MSIRRRIKAEQEAKEQGLTPTKDLEVDESLLSEEEKEENRLHFPWTMAIIGGVILLAMIAFVIVIVIVSKGAE